MMYIIIAIIAIIIILIILQYKNKNYEPFFSGKCSYFNPFNKYRDPYSVFLWRDIYDKHNRWQDIHKKEYVPFNESTLTKS